MTSQAGRAQASSRRSASGARGGVGTDVAVLLVLALLIRIVAVGRTAVIFNDGPIFLALAGAMEAGHFEEALAHAYHPLYPLLIQLFRCGPLAAEGVAVGISVVAGSLAVLALYAFLAQAWERRVAFVGAFLLAVHPYAVRFSADVQSDALYLLLFLSGIACLYPALRERRPGLAFAAGLLSGAAYLARPEGVGVVLVGSAVAAIAWLRGRWPSGAALGWMASLLSGALLLALPYVVAMRGLAGSWTLSQKKSVPMLLGLDPASFEWPVLPADDGGMTLLGIGVLVLVVLLALVLAVRSLSASRARRDEPIRVGARSLAVGAALLCGLAYLAAPQALPTFSAVVVSTLRPEIMLMLVLGVGSRARNEPQGRSLFIVLVIGLYSVVLFGLLVQYGYVSRRHVLPPLTLVFGYAAAGVLVVAAALHTALERRGWLPRLDGQAVAGIVVGLVAAVGLPKAWHDHRAEELAGRRAAEWLATQEEAQGLVSANRSKLGYYAGRTWKPLRGEDGLPRSLDLLWAEHVRFVIVEEDLLTREYDADPSLLEGSTHWLQARHLVEARGRRAAVFEIVAKGQDR